MPNHKKKKPKSSRAGCLMCKPHKLNGIGDNKHKEKNKLPKDLKREMKNA